MAALIPDITQSVSMAALSVLLISPDHSRRGKLAAAVTGPQARISREISLYPAVDDLTAIIAADYDVAIVDVDPDPETALDVIETLCGHESTMTVMAHAGHLEAGLVMRCMRAGARELLTDPLPQDSVAEALVRASVRRDEMHRHRKPSLTGKLLVFAGAKGGSGVTTVASNFALALARQPDKKVTLLDLNVLGDAALTLGLTAKFSMSDALEQTDRLDPDLLAALMTTHTSGLSVLAAADSTPEVLPAAMAIEKLTKMARASFDYVVVDAGSRALDLHQQVLRAASAVYLVTQVGVSELRNANRFVVWYLESAGGRALEIVLNRFQPRNLEIDEAAVTKALTRPAKWKIPNDYQAVRRAQSTGIPIASEKGLIARLLDEMALAASGRDATVAKKKFSLFGGRA